MTAVVIRIKIAARIVPREFVHQIKAINVVVTIALTIRSDLRKEGSKSMGARSPKGIMSQAPKLLGLYCIAWSA